jgi:hypothetical protein
MARACADLSLIRGIFARQPPAPARSHGEPDLARDDRDHEEFGILGVGETTRRRRG